MPAVEVDHEIGGTRITGYLREVWSSGQVRWQYSRLGGRHELGLWIRHSYASVAERLKKPGSVLSLLLNLILLTLIIAVQFRTLAEIHLKGYIGMFCLVIAALAAGRVVAKRGQEESAKSLILTTSVRNVGVSLVIVTASFPGTAAITSATAYAIFQTIIIALLAWAWGRHAQHVRFVEQKAA